MRAFRPIAYAFAQGVRSGAFGSVIHAMGLRVRQSIIEIRKGAWGFAVHFVLRMAQAKTTGVPRIEASRMMQMCFPAYICILYRAFMNITDAGLALKEARQRRKLSQHALASALGMSRATISALESGRCTEIGFTKLAALLELVGLELTVSERRARPTIEELREERHR